MANTPFSNWIKATNFGFSLGSIDSIDGIEAYIRRSHISRTNSKEVQDWAVFLITGGTIQTGWTDKHVDGAYYPIGTLETKVYGGAADTWGASPALNKTTVENTGFGVGIYCGYPSPPGDPTTSNTVRFYWVGVKVYYTPTAVANAANAAAILFNLIGLTFVGLFFQKAIRRVFRRSAFGYAKNLSISNA